MTHLGFFDVAMASNIPNILFLAPATKEEYLAMMDYALEQRKQPVIIRTPGGPVVTSDRKVNTDFFSYDIVREGEDIAIIGEGAFLQTALQAADILVKDGKNPTVVNPRILSAVVEKTLDKFKGYKTIVTLDDGIVDGGFGQKVAAYMARFGVKVVCLGLKKEFLDRYNVEEVLKANSLTPAQIAALAAE